MRFQTFPHLKPLPEIFSWLRHSYTHTLNIDNLTKEKIRVHTYYKLLYNILYTAQGGGGVHSSSLILFRRNRIEKVAMVAESSTGRSLHAAV